MVVFTDMACYDHPISGSDSDSSTKGDRAAFANVTKTYSQKTPVDEGACSLSQTKSFAFTEMIDEEPKTTAQVIFFLWMKDLLSQLS